LIKKQNNTATATGISLPELSHAASRWSKGLGAKAVRNHAPHSRSPESRISWSELVRFCQYLQTREFLTKSAINSDFW